VSETEYLGSNIPYRSRIRILGRPYGGVYDGTGPSVLEEGPYAIIDNSVYVKLSD